VDSRARKPLLRLVASAGVLFLASVVGLAAHSFGAFVAILGIGLVVEVVLRFTIWR
jgi:hypothetical protein